MREPKQPRQMEAEILETLSCPIEKEMLSELHAYIESLTDEETRFIKKFLERRRAAKDTQSPSEVKGRH